MKKQLFLLAFAITISLQSFAQSLVSINPSTGALGATNLVTQITGANTIFQNSSPQGSLIDVNLDLAGGNYIYGDFFSIVIIDNENFTIEWDIPAGAPVGLYDLNVTYEDWQWGWPNPVYLSLPAAFQVGNPDGYIEGRVFNDANQNGVQDGGELGLSGYTVNVVPGNFNFSTNATGDYSIPALNGNYTVSYVGNTSDQKIIVPGFASSLPVIINNANSSGNNFPTVQGPTSLYPDSAYQGQNIYVTVTGKGFFSTIGGPNGNISSAQLTKSPTTITSNSTKITAIDSNTAIVQFTIPANATLGIYDLRLQIGSGSYTGYHYFNQCFTIVPPPLYMNGIIYFDADSDGVKDLTEIGIANGKVFLSPDSVFAFPQANGSYSFGTVPGTHTISWVPTPGLVLSPGSPSSYTATVSTTTNGYDFGVTSPNPAYSATINLHTCWAGCVHPNYFGITIQNTGLVPYNGYVFMVLDPNMINAGGSSWGGASPDSVIGDTLFWNFTNLQPLSSLVLAANISTPVGGITINYSATVVALNPGGVPVFSATDYHTHVVNCSMDPNEKSVRPIGIFAQHYTLMSDSLVYTVLFQNTGTDTAFTVIVRDTIDIDFDLSTMQILVWSHPVLTEVDLQTRVAKFTFNNINLVDSNTNEAQSHGYIKYLIRPKAGLANGTVVYNHADIYFDFNQPVITNTVFNTLVYVLPVGVAELENNNGVIVIPNPFTNEAVLKFANSEKAAYHFNMYTVEGKLIYTTTTSEEIIRLQKGNLQNGIYMYELHNATNNADVKRGKIVIQ